MTVLHLPPRHLETPAYRRTQQDVIRFIYEREKLRQHGEHQPEWLEPYPGALLGDDLEAHALAALRQDATPELVERLGTPERILAQAHEHAASAAPRYPGYLGLWCELMDRIESDNALGKASADAFPRI
jgi:hypothetical protein